ncbi:unnamed protein product [marine sediment metagenome]|uniref:Uncharacterized protein n=1 Tax=marine sediment metagenome TaxID=412755 RepID=X0Z032_9ZZZZ
MGGGQPDRPKFPVQDPVPSPVPLDVEVLEKERARRRQKVRSMGRAGTILTQGGLGGSDTETQRGTLLGGSA